MVYKPRSFSARWMLSPVEIVAIVAIILIIIGGLFVSVQDALRLEQTLNLNLTQAIILTQGIVNLQREVQLTHEEVTRLLGKLDNPPKPITRYDFVKIQVNKLALQVDSPEIKFIFTDDDLALVHSIEQSSTKVDQL